MEGSSPDQLVVNVVVKDDPFPGTGAFDVLEEIDAGPAIRCLPRVSRLALKIAQGLGHTTTGRAPGGHPGALAAMLGIFAESGGQRAAERGVRKDPWFCSARFPDGAGCGRPLGYVRDADITTIAPTRYLEM